MRTNIEIDDDLMAAAMAAGGFKTKKEAVEEGLRLVRRRQIYNGLLALRGKLQWDDSDAAWAQGPTPEASGLSVQEPQGAYNVKPKPATTTQRSAKAQKPIAAKRSKAK
jgi:Arc/MetJ family transcription regulator